MVLMPGPFIVAASIHPKPWPHDDNKDGGDGNDDDHDRPGISVHASAEIAAKLGDRRATACAHCLSAGQYVF
jgi:hypothetical protein